MIRIVCAILIILVWTTSELSLPSLIQDATSSEEPPQLMDNSTGQAIKDMPCQENASSVGLKYYSAFLDESYLRSINSFWLQFNPPTRTVFYIFGVTYVIIFIVGVSGNLLVITMFFKCTKLLTPATGLVLNLAVSDFIMVAKCPLAAYNNFMMGPALGDLGCRVYGFLGGLSGTASILTLSAIAIERYQVVVHPLHQLNQRSTRRLALQVAFIWIYSLIFAVIPALDIGYSAYVPEGFLTTCSFDYLNTEFKARIFMFIFFTSAYVIPLFIIVYCYSYILKIVVCSKRIRANATRAKTENRLSFVVAIIIFAWFVAWTPYSIVVMLGVFGQKSKISPFSSMVPAIFCKIAACVDPYIYAVSRSKFRMEFRRVLDRQISFKQFSIFASSFRTQSTSGMPMQVLGNNAAMDAGDRCGPRFQRNQLVPVPEEIDIDSSEIVKIDEVPNDSTDNTRF